MKHCYETALYTTEAQALSITHVRISLPHACAITGVVYGRNAENEPVLRIKMADYRTFVSMGMLWLSSKSANLILDRARY